MCVACERSAPMRATPRRPSGFRQTDGTVARNMADSGDIAIGIDLGTSYSCVSILENGQPTVIPNEWGERTHASVVSFLEDGTVLVGNSAKRNIITNAENTVYSAKRLIGRFYFSDEVKKAQAVMPYKIVEGENNSVRIQIRESVYSLPEISALVLKEMKAIVENYLGHEVKKAVITVPAYFNDNQRQATKDAGRIAGLDVLRILNEPTAAALAYGFGRDITQRIAVYDLGGGTFDISVLEIGKDGVAKINVEGICQDPSGKVMDLGATLTEAEFNKMVMDLVQRTFKVCDEALQSAKITAQDLDAVILVGGPTRLPIIRTSVKHYFGKDVMAGIDPDEVVAMGAAIQAHSLLDAKGEHYLLDVTPLTLRVGTVGGYTDKIIDKNTPIPIERSKSYTTNRDGQEKVKIRVYQGESNKASECELLGEFEFSGFRIAYRGEVRIEVTFEIDTNGIVNVTAADVETGQKTSCTIRLSSGLTEEMIKEAQEKNARTQLARGEAAA